LCRALPRRAENTYTNGHWFWVDGGWTPATPGISDESVNAAGIVISNQYSVFSLRCPLRADYYSLITDYSLSMPEHPTSSQAESMPENSSGRLLPWQIDSLPAPPAPGWRLWIGLIGPGVVLAGTSIGSGEWLFGPAVTAQYGGTLLWLATVSIVLQVFCNLMMMRYTVYCGEPIIVGGLRTWPGPLAWIACYGLLDLAAIWPYNASNAAVPLAAAILGRLPGATDLGMVKSLGYAIFVLSFVPLIFGGTVYRMLEKIMTIKLVVVLVYLSLIAVFMVSAPVAWEVISGFFRFGTMPIRADTTIVSPHFSLTDSDGADKFTVKGTVEKGVPVVTEFRIVKGPVVTSYKLGSPVPAELQPRLGTLVARVQSLARPNHFFIQTQDSGFSSLSGARLPTALAGGTLSITETSTRI
jgi:hypothetical protein